MLAVTNPAPSHFRAWMQLLRPPNLFTVPGDPLIGYLMANAGIVDWTLVPAMLASLFLYSAGLVMNDLADQAEDQRDRPSRPLPSGAVPARGAWMLTAVLAAAGLLSAWAIGSRAALLCAVSLLAAIALYNFLTKRWTVVGALNMGLCRTLSILLGAYTGPLAIVQMGILLAIILGLYIAAVTNLARHETRPAVPVLARILPALVLILGCSGGIPYASGAPAKQPAIALFILSMAMALWLAIKMFRRPTPPLPPMIGAHIRLLLPVQAAWCWTANPWGVGFIAALVLLALWPVSKWVSRFFYAS